MRAGLFHVNVLARLTRPDSHQGVPVIGCCNRNGIDRLVLQKLANVHVSGWLGNALFLHCRHTLAHNILVDVAHRGDLNVLQLGKVPDVIHTTSADAANRHSHPIVGTEDPVRPGYERHPACSRQTRGARHAPLEETSAA